MRRLFMRHLGLMAVLRMQAHVSRGRSIGDSAVAGGGHRVSRVGRDVTFELALWPVLAGSLLERALQQLILITVVLLLR